MLDFLKFLFCFAVKFMMLQVLAQGIFYDPEVLLIWTLAVACIAGLAGVGALYYFWRLLRYAFVAKVDIQFMSQAWYDKLTYERYAEEAKVCGFYVYDRKEYERHCKAMDELNNPQTFDYL